MKKYFFILLIISINVNIFPQSLTGISGLFSVPYPYIGNDGEVSPGVNFIDRHYTDYSKGERDLLNVFVTINYLPFVELGFRATRQLNYHGKGHTVDRMFNVKIKIYDENEYLPTLALGFNNPYSTIENANHFNSTYFVAAKQIDTEVGDFITVIGYGIDIINAADYQFIGLFGGLSFKPYDFIELIVENDAERFNGAIRLNFFEHIHLLAGLMNFSDFSGGFSFSFRL
ncbi:YjbH domain-containing protein [Melioribacter sp. OK-6-Me]|uniref:YjbH domain-containing protein n=1 Tax=Melioribacter sp. OK-6-Me TaxID=3423433 RepID=UPI003EDA7802